MPWTTAYFVVSVHHRNLKHVQRRIGVPVWCWSWRACYSTAKQQAVCVIVERFVMSPIRGYIHSIDQCWIIWLWRRRLRYWNMVFLNYLAGDGALCCDVPSMLTLRCCLCPWWRLITNWQPVLNLDTLVQHQQDSTLGCYWKADINIGMPT